MASVAALAADDVPDICGFVSIRVCAPGRTTYSRAVHIRPAQITAISNPKDSPEGCLRMFVGTRTIYVHGTYDDVASRVHKAQGEVDEHSCKEAKP